MTDGVETAAVLALAETHCYLRAHEHAMTEPTCLVSRTHAEATLVCLRLNVDRARAVVAALTQQIDPDDQRAINRRLRTFGEGAP